MRWIDRYNRNRIKRLIEILFELLRLQKRENVYEIKVGWNRINYFRGWKRFKAIIIQTDLGENFCETTNELGSCGIQTKADTFTIITKRGELFVDTKKLYKDIPKIYHVGRYYVVQITKK